MPSNRDTPLKTYLDHLARGELAYQYSPAAGRAVFYPRVLCPFTGSDRLEWRISKGLGTVHATTVVHPAEGKPFNVALVDCDEGFRSAIGLALLFSLFEKARMLAPRSSR